MMMAELEDAEDDDAFMYGSISMPCTLINI
jgi:hypothetical protein